MNTGGSAFPVHPNVNLDLDKRWCGMTLRDYFAAKVLQSYMVNDIWRDDVYRLAAETSYKVADAMLKAREQNG